MSQSIDEVLLGTPGSRRGSGGSGDYEGEGEGEGDKFVRQLFESLLLGTRASNAIPDGDGQEDYAYNATFPEFRSRAEGCGKQVLELIQIFLNHVRQDGEFGLPEVGDAGDPEVFQGIADIVEALLEDVDSYLDDVSGKGANQQVTLMRHQLQTVASAARSGPHKYATMMANVADISKPQEAFQDEIDNDRNTPFVPRLREKPNAVTPLDLSPRKIPNMSASMGMITEGRDDSALGDGGLDSHYPHPYEVEIRTFHYMPGQVQAPDSSFLVRPESLDEDDAPAATFVDTVEALDAMIAHIVGNGKGGNTSSGSSDDDEGGGVGGGRGSGTRRACREIAVDLEAHSVRSFQGVVCLVQMSTRERDFIVDPLKLRLEMTRLLGVFTDPSIVKVLHGSDQDILWLQRDLGLYVVNMFDTGQAARQLGLSSFGLAHLLQVFCDFTADKTHQLSDWRQRPLPADMLKYAQGDTHYLLYVYDRLRADLERAGGDVAIKSVLDASREICLRRYEKPMFRERGWAAMLRRQGEWIGQEYGEDSGRILSALWEWRDAVARSEDESTGYVMPFPVMLRIAKKLPSTRDELESCAHPLSPLVRRKAEEVLTIVENAKNGIEPLLDTTHGHPRTPAISGATAAAASTVPSSATPRMPPGSGGVLGGVAGPSRTFNPVSSAEPYFRPYNVTPSGASQFVLSEGSRGSPSPLLVHQSPVLNTEELYRAAGWMTPLPKDPRLGDDGQDDDEGEERDTDGDPRSINSSSKGLVSLAAKNDQLDTSQRMGHSMALGSGAPATGGVEAAPGPGEAGVRTADRIRDEIAREPMLSLRNLDGFGDEEVGAAGRGNDGSGAEDGSSSGEGEVGLEPGGEESPDEPGIPKSIAEIYEISNRNRRRNKEKKKLRETASEASTSSPTSRTTHPYLHQHPHQQLHHHQQQQQPGGRGEGGSDSAPGFAVALDSPAAEGPAASYFSGRKRQKGDAPGQGLGLLVDRNRRGPGAGDGRGVDEDTMEFMEDLGWITPEQREALSQQHSPSSGPSTSAGDGSAASPFDRSLIGSANGLGNPGGDGLGGGDPGDVYTRAGTGGARSRGGGRQGGPGAAERGGGLRGPGPAGRGGGGGRGKGGTPKRDRDGGRGSGAGIGVGRGPAGGVQPPAFRGYDLGQAPSSMGAYQAQGQRDGGSGGGGNGRGGGVFNPFLAPQGVVGTSAGMGGAVPGGSVQRGYGGGRQQQQSQQQQQQQSQHWRPRPDTEKTKSITYGAPPAQGIGSGRGGGGGNGSRRGR